VVVVLGEKGFDAGDLLVWVSKELGTGDADGLGVISMQP
jgi:hypothetical protein